MVNYSAGTHKGLTAKVQVLNMDASVAWEKEATVDSNEDTTDKCIKLEFPENLSKVHFIKMTLTEDGKVVSDNFYHRSLEENNYQDLCQLAKVALQSATTVDKNADGTWSAVSVIENKTSTPALMIRLNVVGGKDDQQILSMFPAFSQSLDLHSPPAVLNFLYVLSSLEFRGPSYYRLSSTLSSLPPSPSHSGSSAGISRSHSS